MNLVAEHKHKIGFRGPLLRPSRASPQAPVRYDSAGDAFLQRYRPGRMRLRLNIEATTHPAGHTFEHEVAYALAATFPKKPHPT